MHLVMVEVNTPGWCVSSARLDEALKSSAAGTDGLQHVYLETRVDLATISLYLQATDSADAVELAEQLCRRTFAAVAQRRQWTVTHARLFPMPPRH